MGSFPIAEPATPVDRSEAERIVEKLLALKGAGEEVAALEARLNAIVYRAYGLSPEEIALVESWFAERTGGKEGSERQESVPERPVSVPERVVFPSEAIVELPERVVEAPETPVSVPERVDLLPESQVESSENVSEAPESGEFRLRAKNLPEQKRIEFEKPKPAPIDNAPDGRNARCGFFMEHILASMRKGKAYAQNELLRATLQRLRGRDNVRLTEKARAELEPALRKAVREGRIEKTAYEDEYRKV